MDEVPKNPLEEYIEDNISIEGVDGVHCLLLHPKIAAVIEALPTDPQDMENVWERLFTPMGDQFRHCLVTEIIKHSVINNFEPTMIQSGEDTHAIFTLTGEDLWKVLFIAVSLAKLVDERLQDNGDL